MKIRFFIADRLMLIIVLLVPFAFTACRTQTAATLPLAKSFSHTEVVSDTSPSSATFTRIPETGVWIRSAHSQDSLMLEIKTRDTLTLQSLLVNGVSIVIDPKAGTKPIIGMTFPAARSEMMRRQDEILLDARQQNDTIPARFAFNPAPWVEAIQKRETIITTEEGSQFADRQNASISLEDNGELVYRVRFAFEQLGISAEDQQRISIGVISRLHQAQMAGGQGGAVATRPDIQGRDRRQTQSPQRQQPMPRPRFIPVNAWIAILINEEMPEVAPKDEEGSTTAAPGSDSDDIYFRRQ